MLGVAVAIGISHLDQGIAAVVWLIYTVIAGSLINYRDDLSWRRLLLMSTFSPLAMTATFLFQSILLRAGGYERLLRLSGIPLSSAEYLLISITIFVVSVAAIFLFSFSRKLVLTAIRSIAPLLRISAESGRGRSVADIRPQTRNLPRRPADHISTTSDNELQGTRSLVFLCHGNEDKHTVEIFYNLLCDSGFDAWLDKKKLVPGQDWEREIRRALRRSAVVVVFLSESSTSKVGFVQKEVRLALDLADEQPEGSIYLIPAKLEPCDVPDRLRHLHWVDLSGSDGTAQLIAAVQTAFDARR